MSNNELTIFKNGAVPSTVFADVNLPAARLNDGVAGQPWARVSYKASHWAIVNEGKTEPLTRVIDGRLEENPNLDIVILEAAKHSTKAWYAEAYDPRVDSRGPDCFSSNGVVPDADARMKQDSGMGCLNCPKNAWGSKIRRDTGEATRGKDCADHKKLVVVPAGDIENKIYGGPMLLQVPPSSLKRLGPYQNMLQANSFHYAMVWTRITFEQGADISYPLFKFDALAALDDVQAEQVKRMLVHPLTSQILRAAVQESDAGFAEAAGDRAPPHSASIHVLRPAGDPAGQAGTEGSAAAAAAKPAADTSVQAQPVQTSQPAKTQSPQLTPAQQRLADLKAALAAAEAEAAAPPEPELTEEEKQIKAMEEQLAALRAKTGAKAPAADKPKATRAGRPRQTGPRTPPVAPTNMTSAPATEAKGPPLPSPVGVPATGNDEALSKIQETLRRANELV